MILTHINTLRSQQTKTCCCPHGNCSNRFLWNHLPHSYSLLHTLFDCISLVHSYFEGTQPQVIEKHYLIENTLLWRQVSTPKFHLLRWLPRRTVSFILQSASIIAPLIGKKWRRGGGKGGEREVRRLQFTSVGTGPRAYHRLMPPLSLWKTLLLPERSLLPNSSTPHGCLLFPRNSLIGWDYKRRSPTSDIITPLSHQTAYVMTTW